jgi:hypothetical protein
LNFFACGISVCRALAGYKVPINYNFELPCCGSQFAGFLQDENSWQALSISWLGCSMILKIKCMNILDYVVWMIPKEYYLSRFLRQNGVGQLHWEEEENFAECWKGYCISLGRLLLALWQGHAM